MLAKDAAKRKRQIQPTIDALFKRQKRLESGEGTSSVASLSETDQGRQTEVVMLNDKSDDVEERLPSTVQDEKLALTTGSLLLQEGKPTAAPEQTLEYEMDPTVIESSPDKPLKLGCPVAALNQAPQCCVPERPLNPQPGYTILFRPHVCADKPPRPYPDTYRDSWDRSHVRMPCSKESLYPVKRMRHGTTAQKNQLEIRTLAQNVVEKKLISRWELIRNSLRRPMTSSYDLEEAILTYNAHYSKRWNFRTLHLYLLEKMTTEEHREFFSVTLPGIIDLAVKLPTICTQTVPLLKKQKEHTIILTQQQVSSLLANAFLCTFPRRNGVKLFSEHEFGNYPEINFSRLFQGDSRDSSGRKLQKLKCILHYFKKITQQPPVGTISFSRKVLKPDETPKWHSSSCTMCRLHVSSDGTIEDDAPGFAQVDFANEFVGGGVLGEGCVQEEIRFAICPELILSRLFTERLEENESLVITGSQRFSNYSGYSDTFRWTGNHEDTTPRDSHGRLHSEVIAIDAKLYSRYYEQFSPRNLKRDLEKAYCGFYSRGTDTKNLTAAATGKWGCGAFNGDPELKGLIQLMAASASSRDLVYFTFGDKAHAQDLHDIHNLLTEKNITVDNLWRMLNEYRKELDKDSGRRSLFCFIRDSLQEDTQCSDNYSGSTIGDDIINSANDEGTSPLLFEDTPP